MSAYTLMHKQTHLLVVCKGPDEAESDMLGGEDNKTRCKGPFLPGQEVKHLHHAMDSLRLLDKHLLYEETHIQGWFKIINYAF